MEHTFKQSPKHDCGRCGATRPLSELLWQQGVLVCKRSDCFDSEVLGARDAKVMAALDAVALSDEGQPDKKLQNIGVVQSDDDIYF